MAPVAPGTTPVLSGNLLQTYMPVRTATPLAIIAIDADQKIKRPA
jgi:hypothetical protein